MAEPKPEGRHSDGDFTPNHDQCVDPALADEPNPARAMSYQQGRSALRPPPPRRAPATATLAPMSTAPPGQLDPAQDAPLFTPDPEAMCREPRAQGGGATPGAAVTAEEIAAERARYKVTHTRARLRKFVNPRALSMYPVKEGGERSVRFGTLVKRSKAANALREELEVTLPPELAAARAALAKKPSDRKRAAAVAALEAQLEAKKAEVETAEAALTALADQVKASFIAEHQALAAANAKRLAELEATAAAKRDQITRVTAERAQAEAALDGAKAGPPASPGGAPLGAKEAKAQQRALKAKLADADRQLAALKRELHKTEGGRDELMVPQRQVERMKGISLVIDVMQHQYDVSYTSEGGAKTTYDMPNTRGGVNVERPEGFFEGGKAKFTEEDFAYATENANLGLTGSARTKALADAKGALSVIRKHEGSADSINTWDRAVITLGPGLAAFGVLESVFANVKETDPAFFRAQVQCLGVDVAARRFTYRVPGGGLLRGDAAKEAMAADPLVMAGLRRVCATHEFRRQMVVRTYETSVAEGFHWSLTARGDAATLGLEQPAEPAPSGAKSPKKKPAALTLTVPWSDVTVGLDNNLVNAALTVIASHKHASGNTRGLRSAAEHELMALAKGAGVSVKMALQLAPVREALVRFVVSRAFKSWRDLMSGEFGPDVFKR